MTIERPMFPPIDATRRRILSVTVGAVVATIAPPASATAPANDPVFYLIEAHRRAHVAHMESLALQTRLEQKHGNGYGGWVSEKPCHDENAAFEALIAMAAVTLPGLLAKLDYLQNLDNDDETEWMVRERVDTRFHSLKALSHPSRISACCHEQHHRIVNADSVAPRR